MTFLYLLLVAYGVTFGLQHKLPFLWKRSEWTDALLSCSYCTGFHAGWLTWLLYGISQASLLEQPIQFAIFIDMFLFAFASAAFSYLMDVLSQWLEMSAQK